MKKESWSIFKITNIIVVISLIPLLTLLYCIKTSNHPQKLLNAKEKIHTAEISPFNGDPAVQNEQE